MRTQWRTSAAGRAAFFVALALGAWLPPLAADARGADGDFERRSSAHFVLYQDVAIDQSGGFYGSRRFEQQILDELERAYEALDDRLGLRPRRKIDVLVYDPDLFDAHFGGLFRFQAAGFYQGVIRVRGATRFSEQLSRVLHHELVHAALDAAAPSYPFPGWVNEGIAEWFEVREQGKRGLSERERALLGELARGGGLHGLAEISTPGFGGMQARAARVAYLQSYALIDYLVRHHGERSLSGFTAELTRTRNLDRSLRRIYRIDAKTLASRFLGELG